MAYNSALDRYPTPGDNGGCGGRADVIVPSDTTDFTNYYTSLYIGVSGDLAITPLRNSADVAVVYKNVPVGFFPMGARRVWVTGTSALQIIGNRD